MKKISSCFLVGMILCLLGSHHLQAQLKLGGLPPVNPKAILDLESTTRGLLLPRMTTVQRNTMGSTGTLPRGLMIYNLDQDCIEYWNGTTWKSLCEGGSGGGTITGFSNCPGTASGTVTEGTTYTSGSGVTITLNYTGGNGGAHGAVSQASTGVTGLVVSLAAGNFATGSGSLVFQVTGTPAGSGTAQFNVTLGGQTCVLQLTVNPGVAPLPANVTLTAGQKQFIPSVSDNNYLPYTAPVAPADITTFAPDGATEPLIDFQGTLTTTGIAVRIPYTVASGTANLPAYSQTVIVPASLTEDGIARNVVLSYPAQTLSAGSGIIIATLQAVGGTLNAKKLDINRGIGNDDEGVLLAQFTLATNGSGGTGNIQLRDIGAIPDREYNGVSNHRNVYLPIATATGRIWLNNNLGANYSRITHSDFNPDGQATNTIDHRAYGSMYQWGRYSDGHELINWTASDMGAPFSLTTATLSSTDNPPNTFITTSGAPDDWRNPQNNSLWQGVNGINNPCPLGFRLPTQAEWQAEITANGMTSPATAASSPLRLTLAGNRRLSIGDLSATTVLGYCWSATISGTGVYRFQIESSGVSMQAGTARAWGFPVRCIKD